MSDRFQKCPVCEGHGFLSYPKGVAPGQKFTSSSTGNFPCHRCAGIGTLDKYPASYKPPEEKSLFESIFGKIER